MATSHRNQQQDTNNTQQNAQNAAQDDQLSIDGQTPTEVPRDTQSDAQDDAGQEKSKGNREAAKYRTQLREVETERDQLTEQVSTLQKQVVNDQIMKSARGVNPELVWELGTDPAELLNEDGSVNQNKVNTTVGRIAKRFGITPRPDPAQVAAMQHHAAPTKSKLFNNRT